MLSTSVASVLTAASSVGVGGSRTAFPAAMACGWSVVSSLLVSRPAILVSCGSGVPSLVRDAFPLASVFSASDPVYRGLGRAAYAARAAAMVRALSLAPSPLWVCFPAGACPAVAAGGVGRSWLSCGSGSWSECRLAAGLGVSVLVFLPSGLTPPCAWGSWSCVGPAAGGRWFLLASCAPSPTLF